MALNNIGIEPKLATIRYICNFNNFWPKFLCSEMGVAENGLGIAFQILPLNDFGSLMVLKQLPMAKNSEHINAHSTLACYSSNLVLVEPGFQTFVGYYY